MIIINEKFSTERDKYQWLLHEAKQGASKEGEPIVTTSTSYHSNLKAVCNEVANRQLGECESAEEVAAALAKFSIEISELFDGRGEEYVQKFG
jgi:phosphoribosylaminoimidazole-succinocarboxamide synthase